MKKTNKKVALLGLTITSVAAAASVIACANIKGIDGTSVFASNGHNDYGCVSNCTGEYYPSHINRLVREDHTLNGVENVRIIAKVSVRANAGWFQDITNDTVYTSANAKLDPQFKTDWCNGLLLTISGTINGLSGYKLNDTIGFYGTINFRAKGDGYAYDTIEILNPVVYKINSMADLSLLQPVVYLK